MNTTRKGTNHPVPREEIKILRQHLSLVNYGQLLGNSRFHIDFGFGPAQSFIYWKAFAEHWYWSQQPHHRPLASILFLVSEGSHYGPLPHRRQAPAT